jgi:5-formyltetrahydrofolate cyclo-ligase
MQVSDILAQKKQLRAQFSALRAGIPAEQKAAWDAALCREIATHPAFLACDELLCFFPVRDEPNFTALYQLARERGVKTAFPRCTGVQMSFHVVKDERELEPGRFGIPTPREDAPLAACTSRTLCLLPALAATKKGLRLGYGGGFYDRFLPGFPGTAMLPIYGVLLCDALPCEQTDRTADLILTEKGELTQNA